MRYVLAIDEGTTGVRALIFDESSAVVASAYRELTMSYPQPGWVEMDAEVIWEATRAVCARALQAAGRAPRDLSAIGVCNQRATTVVWERGSGRPVYPAIVWQDIRAADRVPELMAQGIFTNSMASAAKLEWVLRRVSEGMHDDVRGQLCFGTIDSWLVWNLTGGMAHVTDYSNASCTSLYDAMNNEWDQNALKVLQVPPGMLPALRSSSEVYGQTTTEAFGAEVPVAGIAGDQQAAMFGELGTEPGAVKITFGTSAMADVNTGGMPVLSTRGAYPLILWGLNEQRTFCLEGTAMTAGAAVQWLRDGLGILQTVEESASLAQQVADSGGVWAVPAFQGLGTPHMDPSARAVIGGLSRASTRTHVVRAVLEGIAYRSREVLETLLEDSSTPVPARLRVDGGAAANDFLLQHLADVLGLPVERPHAIQASALGAAYLAGLATGVWHSLDEVKHAWRSGRIFEPRWSQDQRDSTFRNWQKAIAAARERIF
ncbi:MAG TPA: glycerol kinase GlpK [Candidatus Margulisiibacteriota bacterium]|nr:glycerol kinase GlpK [Candidatus Margulisiibacteriota bacterium]